MSFQTELAAAGLSDLGKPGSPEWEAKTYLTELHQISFIAKRDSDNPKVQQWAGMREKLVRRYWDRMSPEAQKIARELEEKQREKTDEQRLSSNEGMPGRFQIRQAEPSRVQRVGPRPTSPYDRTALIRGSGRNYRGPVYDPSAERFGPYTPPKAGRQYLEGNEPGRMGMRRIWRIDDPMRPAGGQYWQDQPGRPGVPRPRTPHN